MHGTKYIPTCNTYQSQSKIADITMIYININIKYTFMPQLKNFYRNNQ